MILLISVSLLMLLAIAGIVFVTFSGAGAAFKEYDQTLQSTANHSLAEMFIFVDERKLKLYCFLIFFIMLCIMYFASQSIVISLMVSSLVFLLPNVVVRLIKKIRMNRFNFALPDALLSMSSMLRSGMNLSGALTLVASESKGPLGQEFGLLLNEIKMGVEFDRALDGMYSRMPLPDLELTIAGMKISREVGGSLSDVLERLSSTIRRRLEMEGKIKSLTSMGVLQGWVMTLLPLVVGYAIYLIEPDTMMKLFSDWRGWIACGVVFILEFLGYQFIRKIVNIDV